MSARLNRELEEVLSKLGPEERRQVLEYARSFGTDEDTRKPDLMRFVGSISKEDIKLMREAIEEDFERVHGPA